MRAHQAHAIVVMPPLAGRRAPDAACRRWLSRAALRRDAPRRVDLERVLAVLGRPAPASGLAALRLWGDTGERPRGWVAAADAAFLEARLDHLHLHALADRDLSRAELRELLDDLGQMLFADAAWRLVRVGRRGYLCGEAGFATAGRPPALLDGERVARWLPQGRQADAGLALGSEIEMCLHRHAVNAARVRRGLQPVNGLWIWGGGYALPAAGPALPPLYSDEPLLRGYWHAAGGAVADYSADGWPCAAGDVVVTLPQNASDADIRAALDALRARQAERRATVTLLLAERTVATLRPGDRWRYWRRNAACILGEPR